MANPVVPSVVVGSIGYVEMTHELAKVPKRGFHQKMKMIFHQHIAVEFNLVSLGRLSKDFQKTISIFIIVENITFLIVPINNVVNSVWELYS